MVDHPYVFPVRDVDFNDSSQDKSWLVLVHPSLPQGSLKDVMANDASVAPRFTTFTSHNDRRRPRRTGA